MFNLASFLKDGFLMIIFKCFHYIQFIKKDKGTKQYTLLRNIAILNFYLSLMMIYIFGINIINYWNKKN